MIIVSELQHENVTKKLIFIAS